MGRHLCVLRTYVGGFYLSNESVSRHLDKFETAAGLLPSHYGDKEKVREYWMGLAKAVSASVPPTYYTVLW